MIFVTETWLNETILDSMFCPNLYRVIRCDRKNAWGGGVLLIYHNSLKIKSFTPNIIVNFEFEFISVDQLDTNNKVQSQFTCFYVSPSVAANTEALKIICNCINICTSSANIAYTFGDFNLPHIDWNIPAAISDSGQSQHYFVEFCIDNALQQRILDPTHQAGNILDLLLCNSASYSKMLQYDVGEPFYETCGHYQISFVLQCSYVFNSLHTARPTRLNLKKADYECITV